MPSWLLGQFTIDLKPGDTVGAAVDLHFEIKEKGDRLHTLFRTLLGQSKNNQNKTGVRTAYKIQDHKDLKIPNETTDRITVDLYNQKLSLMKTKFLHCIAVAQ